MPIHTRSDQEDFKLWRSTFPIERKTDEISQILSTNDKIREAHSKLGWCHTPYYTFTHMTPALISLTPHTTPHTHTVPVVVSYGKFWERYFYRLNKLHQEEERRAALVKRESHNLWIYFLSNINTLTAPNTQQIEERRAERESQHDTMYIFLCIVYNK